MGKKISNIKKTNPEEIGIALSGGAPRGAIYEIGVLKALEDVLDGITLDKLGVYVGVSAGGFLAACLANGLTPDQMCRAIVKTEPGEHPFAAETFFKPAFKEYLKRARKLPGLLRSVVMDLITGREKRIWDALTHLTRLLPVGIFDNDPIREYVQNIFSMKNRTDNFNKLACKLYIISTDLESGQIVCFGKSGYNHIPISKAVQATSALPGLYPPVKIDECYYVDGVLNKTMHAGAALESGAKLVFAINSIVPVDLRNAFKQKKIKPGLIVEHGLVSVLTQALLSLIHSRMVVGFKSYKSRFPGADIIFIEPAHDDDEYFFTNIFSFKARCRVCNHAYTTTLDYIRKNKTKIKNILRKHGIRLREDILADPGRQLWPNVGLNQCREDDVMCFIN